MALNWEKAASTGSEKCRTDDDMVLFFMSNQQDDGYMLYAHVVFWDGRTRCRISLDEGVIDAAQRDELAEKMVGKLAALRKAALA
jgi:hypothetical protein